MRVRLFFLCIVLGCSAAAHAAGPLLVLGDSLSAAHNIPQQAGWVALLEHRLNQRGAPAPKVINASISGETTAGALARLPALLAQYRPSLVLVELGGNDGLRGLPPAELAANLDAIIRASRDADAKVLLLGIDLPPNYGRAYRDRFRAVYSDLAKKHRVPLLPFLLDGVALQPGLMQEDGVHPTAAGQPRVLDNVWALLQPML
ncbi:MAG: arylesterase [Xanthomonadaceae bacterium]|nr:arylesterase [Xanthomonadaceae bacterium]